MGATAVQPEEDELAIVMRQTRDRFVAGFAARRDDIMARLAIGSSASLEEARQIVHKVAGLAGTVGLPDVSRIAGDIETMLLGGPAAPGRVVSHVALMQQAFDRECDGAATRIEIVPDAAAASRRILVVDDDNDQRAITTGILERAGYHVVGLPLADTVIETAERVAPSAILLDVMMPGIDGHLACRLLKNEPSVSNVPVVFVSSHAALEERLAGLALGAVDYVAKPVDSQELLFRVKRAIEQVVVAPEPPEVTGLLEYAEFERLARSLLAAHLCTLVLVRVDAKAHVEVGKALLQDSRRRDLVAQFDRMHLVMLLPDLAAAAAMAWLEPTLKAAADRGIDARGGVAAALAGASTLDALVQEADAGLAEARFHGTFFAQKGERPAQASKPAASQLVLLADDDPDVMRIVDAEMRSLQFTTSLAFDGQAVLAALSAHPVNLIVLDLMLPKVTGFEILHQLRSLGEPRPRMIVLSARGREEDITRAFDLGADDYITKPFRPHELGARVVRLLR